MNETERITLQSELPAGRELDALVAEKVMGWRRVSKGEPYFWPPVDVVEWLREAMPDAVAVDYFLAPPFSTDLSAAWQVAERLVGKGHHVTITSSLVNGVLDWYCGLDPDIDGNSDYDARANTAPLAICRAALATVR